MSLRLEAARRLLAKARDDRYIVARLADDPMAPAWAVGFHAQQAVEKALKAVLAGHGLEHPLTHNLAMLLAKLAEEGLPAPPDAGADAIWHGRSLRRSRGAAGDAPGPRLDLWLRGSNAQLG